MLFISNAPVVYHGHGVTQCIAVSAVDGPILHCSLATRPEAFPGRVGPSNATSADTNTRANTEEKTLGIIYLYGLPWRLRIVVGGRRGGVAASAKNKLR